MTLALHVLIVVAAIIRVLLRPHRDPTSRVAWMVVILALPFLGVLAYLLLGETNIGRKRVAKVKKVAAEMPDLDEIPGWNAELGKVDSEARQDPFFLVGQSISGYPGIGGNHAELMADSNAAIERMVADMDSAISSAWLPPIPG